MIQPKWRPLSTGASDRPQDHVDKPLGVFQRTCKSRKKFLPFAQGSKILLPGRTDRLGLINRQPLQQPSVFLAGKVSYFRRIPGPLEPSVIQTFIIETEPIFFEMQRFDPVTASPAKKEQRVAVGIQFIGIPDDCH